MSTSRARGRPGCLQAWCGGVRDVDAESLQEECLNVHWFEDLTDARAKLQVWKQESTEERP